MKILIKFQIKNSIPFGNNLFVQKFLLLAWGKRNNWINKSEIKYISIFPILKCFNYCYYDYIIIIIINKNWINIWFWIFCNHGIIDVLMVQYKVRPGRNGIHLSKEEDKKHLRKSGVFVSLLVKINDLLWMRYLLKNWFHAGWVQNEPIHW